MALSKADILGRVPKSKEELPREKVNVPVWGGEVWLRALSAAERDDFEVETGEIREGGDDPFRGIRGRVVAWSICDETGQRMFNSSDGEVLGNTDAATMDKLFGIAGRLSGFTKEAIAELEKNLKGTSSDSSPSS